MLVLGPGRVQWGWSGMLRAFKVCWKIRADQKMESVLEKRAFLQGDWQAQGRYFGLMDPVPALCLQQTGQTEPRNRGAARLAGGARLRSLHLCLQMLSPWE